MSEENLLDNKLIETYKDYYPEITQSSKLFEDIKENKAEIFFLRLEAVSDKLRGKLSVSDTDEKFKYPDMLTSAEDMLTIYKDVLVPADKEFTEAMNSGDMEKINNLVMNPLYFGAQALVGNEMPLESEKDVEQVRASAQMSTFNDIFDNSSEVQQMVGEMRTKAGYELAKSGMVSDFVRPGTDKDASLDKDIVERNAQISAFLDERPKEVLALAVINEAKRQAGLPIEKINSVEALKKRCEQKDVQSVAKLLSYTKQDKGLEGAVNSAEKMVIFAQKSRGGSGKVG